MEDGRGINAKWLKFNVPPRPSGLQSVALWPYDKGLVMASGCVGRCSAGVRFEFQAETDLFGLAVNNTLVSTEYESDNWVETDRGHCSAPDRANWGVDWPSGWGLYRRPQAGYYNFCSDTSHSPGLETSGLKQVRYRPSAALQEGAIEDYTDQPATRVTPYWAEQPQGRAELEQRVRAGLEGGGFPFADAWYAHQLDPQTYEDPAEDEEQRDDCRPADSIQGGDPDPLRGTQNYLQDPDRWRARYETVPQAEFPPGSSVPESGLPGVGGPAYMRWGWAALDAEKAFIGWEGWGYRKIVAKHGWGPTALQKTTEALQTTPGRSGPFGGYDQYVGPPYGSRSGRPAACEWIVSVQRAPEEEPERPEMSQAAPMGGIITAHGRFIRPG